MTRYTINIGDDFPIGDDDDKSGDRPGDKDGRRRGPRFGTVLRVLFAISLIGIVIHHPFQVALVTGLVLLFRRHPRFLELRSRMRGMRGPWGEWQRHRADRHGHRHEHNHGPRHEPKKDDRGYGAFV